MSAKEVFVSDYWRERQAKAQEEVTKRGIKQTEEQLQRYYQRTMRNVIGQFEEVYNKVLLSIDKGATPTPADLYKLDTYWHMQGQLREELQKLGDKQAVAMSKQFTKQYRHIYKTVALQDGNSFSEISRETAEQMINQIWAADGQSWSSRIWKNVSKLQQELNDNLIDCVLTGKPTDILKRQLVERFGVSYSRADSIVRTEYAHIQTQAAQQRYKDSGVQQVEIWADYDERRCDICGNLHQKKYSVHDRMPIPAHPRCRCTIIPVVEPQFRGEQMKLEGF
jgi:SPP1 gp7 family putative phage head morphogenesis protein